MGDGHGARQAYLQVADENHAALGFYDRLGFARHHPYHYRRPPQLIHSGGRTTHHGGRRVGARHPQAGPTDGPGKCASQRSAE